MHCERKRLQSNQVAFSYIFVTGVCCLKPCLTRHKVLWYDSVTADGALRWQNELNAANKCVEGLCA
jgi:hypothetical protein